MAVRAQNRPDEPASNRPDGDRAEPRHGNQGERTPKGPRQEQADVNSDELTVAERERIAPVDPRD